MSAISHYAAKKTLDAWFAKTAFTPPEALWLALFETDPGPEGSGIEVSGPGYARSQIPGIKAASLESGVMTAKNEALISMPEASGNWTKASYFAVFDKQAGGNLIAYAPLRIAKTAEAGDQLEFKTDTLEITLR